MEQQPKPQWYKKKRYIIPLAVATVFGFSAYGNTQVSLPTQQTVPVIQREVAAPVSSKPAQDVKEVQTQTSVQVKKAEPRQEDSAAAAALSNDNYYVNSRGNTVHSPAYTEDNSIPAGASAQCKDGTYSFSQSRRGTCSRHGGVAEWY